MGGEIVVESTEGVGSEFAFELTFPVAAAPLARALQAPKAVMPKLSGRILVAEDDRVNGVVISTMLAKMGVEHVLVPNGRAAVEAVGQQEWDLVLMDLQMPELNGLDAARHIRSDTSATALPIIALTANVLPEDRLECEAAGMNGFLTKPVRYAELYGCLQQWLAPAPSASPALQEVA
jgi:CheY-like chemotaxis protein